MASLLESASSAARLLREILLAPLELGDVGVDGDGAAVLGAALADHDPAAIAAPLHLRLGRVAVTRKALGDPLLQPALRVADVPALGGATDDRLEPVPRRQVDVKAGVEQFAVAGIADHQPVFGIVAGEPFGDALDGFGEAPLADAAGLFGAAERRDVIDPGDPLGAREADVAALVGDLNVGHQVVQELPVLGPVDHLLVQELAATLAQTPDDAGSVVEILPEPPGVEELELGLVVADHLAKPPLVQQKPPRLVDHHQPGRAVFEDLAQLPFLLGDPRLLPDHRGDVVDPENARAAGEAHVASLVGDLNVGEQ